MTNDIGDIVKMCKSDALHMIVDIERSNRPDTHYMFYIYNMLTESCETWFEPFDQQLNPLYWDTLA